MSRPKTKGLRFDRRERMEKRQESQGWYVDNGVKRHRTPSDQLAYLDANGYRAIRERAKLAKKLTVGA